MSRIAQLFFILLLGASPILAGYPETDKLVEEAKKDSGEITAKKLKKLLDDNEDLIMLDVREENQRAEGQIHADEFFAITRGNLEFKILYKIDDKDIMIVTYCRNGGRGAFAAQTLRKMGYKNVVSLQGGLKGWAKAGYPIDTGLGVTKLEKK